MKIHAGLEGVCRGNGQIAVCRSAEGEPQNEEGAPREGTPGGLTIMRVQVELHTVVLVLTPLSFGVSSGTARRNNGVQYTVNRNLI